MVLVGLFGTQEWMRGDGGPLLRPLSKANMILNFFECMCFLAQPHSRSSRTALTVPHTHCSTSVGCDQIGPLTHTVTRFEGSLAPGVFPEHPPPSSLHPLSTAFYSRPNARPHQLVNTHFLGDHSSLIRPHCRGLDYF